MAKIKKGKRMKVSRSFKRAEEKPISKRKKFWLKVWAFLEGLCAVGVVLFCVFTFMVLIFLMVFVFELPAIFVGILSIMTILWMISRRIRKVFLNKK